MLPVVVLGPADWRQGGRRPRHVISPWWRLLFAGVSAVVMALFFQLLLADPNLLNDELQKEDSRSSFTRTNRTLDNSVKATETRSSSQASASHAPRSLVAVGLVELQEEIVPWKVSKLLVPIGPEVAKWWSADDADFTVKLRPCSTGGDPHVHLQIISARPLVLNPSGGKQPRVVDGLVATVYLPPGTIIEECRIGWAPYAADIASLTGMGQLRALRLSCPVTANRGADSAGVRRGRFLTVAVFTWLLLPWPLLLIPTLVYSVARPLSLIMSLCIARMARSVRRMRRLWRLRRLLRRVEDVDCIFGEGEPCCICFGDDSDGGCEAIIALLPCRHALHEACYRSWVVTDSYPSLDLICPLCRCHVTAVGKLKVVHRTASKI